MRIQGLTELFKKVNPRDASFSVKVIAIGIFFVLIAIAYSLIFRGSADIKISATTKRLIKHESKKY